MDGHLACQACSSGPPPGFTGHRCPGCGGPLSFRLGGSAFPAAAIASRPATLWRYAEALPRFADPVSLGEPMTPLLSVPRADLDLRAKCEFCLPTGSYKDRGAAFVTTYLRQAGATEMVEDSSGNAGAALAAYAARAGMPLKVFCPSSASPGKLQQIRLHGAELVRVDGPRPRATEALLAYLGQSRAVYASHLWHPLFLEGVKTMAFEIAEQLGWRAPAAAVCPVGAGSILLGLYRGFRELLAAGAIDALPRLVAVQARGVSPVFRAFQEGADQVAACAAPEPTLAEGIALPAPVRGAELLQAVRQSGGTVVAVSEEEIAAGAVALGRLGLGVEPTSAVVWKGLEHLQRQAPLPAGSCVVMVLSGHGLKATRSLEALLGPENGPQPDLSRRSTSPSSRSR